MKYINPAFRQFFKNLQKNNNTEWFNANRKLYETEVKKPFATFVDALIERVQQIEPEVKITGSEAIMRINKDIRFSKDKTPYNTHVAAIISKAGKKDKSVPGLYIQLSEESIQIFGGAYMLEPPVLARVRKYIAANFKEFNALYSDKRFVSTFGSIKGEQSKKLAPEIGQLLQKEPMLANKQFYFMAELKPEIMESEGLLDTVIGHYKIALPLNNFLKRAMME